VQGIFAVVILVTIFRIVL